MTSAIVVGAGCVGLSTAWYLQEYGVDVTVIDRTGVAAGASWGNAGWLAPTAVVPLAEPGIWKHGVQAMVDSDAALHVPFRTDLALWSFLGNFARRGTRRAWQRTMDAIGPFGAEALSCFGEQLTGGVDSWTRSTPYVVAFAEQSAADHYARVVDAVTRHVPSIQLSPLDDPQGRVPQLSTRVRAAFLLEGQEFIEPGPYMAALGESVVERGATLLTGRAVSHLDGGSRPRVTLDDGETLDADTVVLATGAWLSDLARGLGVRTRVQAGRGYSFTVPTSEPVTQPIYLHHEHLACTPYEGRLRIAGTMEFRGPDEPLQPQRIASIVKHARGMFVGVDLDDRRDAWVGSRPVTTDGMALVGSTRAPGVYVAGGHGMWGIIGGPLTGKLLAKQIVTGRTDPLIAPFDPLR